MSNDSAPASSLPETLAPMRIYIAGTTAPAPKAMSPEHAATIINDSKHGLAGILNASATVTQMDRLDALWTDYRRLYELASRSALPAPARPEEPYPDFDDDVMSDAEVAEAEAAKRVISKGNTLGFLVLEEMLIAADVLLRSPAPARSEPPTRLENGPNDVWSLLIAYGSAQFDCGAWTAEDDEDLPGPYDRYFMALIAAKDALRAKMKEWIDACITAQVNEEILKGELAALRASGSLPPARTEPTDTQHTHSTPTQEARFKGPGPYVGGPESRGPLGLD